MKCLITVLATASAMALSAASANAATASATVSMEILQQVTIVQVSDLNFGTIVPDTVSDVDVHIEPDATNTRDCGILTCADAASVSAGQFDVTGASGPLVDMIGSPTATLSDGNGNTMPIVLEKSEREPLMTGAAVPIYVGGAVTVAANQTPGIYSTSFDLTAEYQ